MPPVTVDAELLRKFVLFCQHQDMLFRGHELAARSIEEKYPHSDAVREYQADVEHYWQHHGDEIRSRYIDLLVAIDTVTTNVDLELRKFLFPRGNV